MYTILQKFKVQPSPHWWSRYEGVTCEQVQFTSMRSRNRGAGGYWVQGLKFSIHTIADLATRIYKFCTLYHISGKLLREKTFADFRVLWLFAKVFSTKFGGMLSLVWHKQAIRENCIFHQFAKVFSLESFQLYGIILYPDPWLCWCELRCHFNTLGRIHLPVTDVFTKGWTPITNLHTSAFRTTSPSPWVQGTY